MIRTQTIDSVLVITIDNPPVNALSTALREALLAAVTRPQDAKAIVITGAGSNFIGGADLREMDAAPAEPVLPVILQAIEENSRPVVAAINGAALGGGLEVALACHARIAAPAAKLGLPEVKLGIVPGAGGTQRLPRLIGLAAAADLIAGGTVIGAAKARDLGLVDAIATNDIVADAVALALSLAQSGQWRRTGALQPKPGDADAAAAPHVKKSRGIPAVAEAVRLVKLAATMSLADALAEERATFLRLRESDEAKALRHIFFAERAAAKVEGLEGIEATVIKTLGVVGLGLMGSGIATAALNSGLAVIGVENTAELAAKGLNRIRDNLDKAVKIGRATPADMQARLDRFEAASDFAALAKADMVIEAVPDELELKRAVFAKISKSVSERTILASNTSYLNPEEIFASVPHPERCLGLHFFSPAHIMRLTEVVRCAETSPQTLASVLALTKKMGKLPVTCRVTEGYVGNRIFSVYRDAAEALVEEGASPRDVDAAMEAWGMAMGPFAVFDMAGLEIGWARRKKLAASGVPQPRHMPVADWLCEMGRYGRKTGRGWFDYRSGKLEHDPEVDELILKAAREAGVQRRAIGADEIVRRLLAAMADEGERLLAEDIVPRASDIDLVLVNGYGFPAWRGGPMVQAGRRNKPA